jgi:hypothetical protein
LAVYQRNVWGDTAVAILDGITGKTLGTAPATNVVYIADKVGPEINDAVFVDNNTFRLSTNEAIASTTISDTNTDLQIGNAATIGGVVTGTYTVGSNTITIDTGATFSTSSYIVMTTTATLTDVAGNISTFFDPGEKGIALGNTATSLIDIHTLIGDYTITNLLSNATTATLIGNDGNNYIEGGDATADTITGGKGADEMDAGNGDTYIIHQGDSTLVTFHDNNSSSSVNNGDTFTFANGADTINFWGMKSGSATIQLDSAMSQGALNSAGAIGNDQYALVKGWFNTYNGVFNVGDTGTSTLVVYDGTVGSGISQTAFVLNDTGTLTLNNTAHVITAVI